MACVVKMKEYDADVKFVKFRNNQGSHPRVSF